MRKILIASSILALLGASITVSVLAQPPAGDERPDGPPPRREGDPERGRRPPHPVMDALDKDKNGEISADELNEAVASLKTLDKNADGKLTDDEIRPPRPDGPPGRRGEDGEGRRPEGEPRGDRPPGDRPPGEDGPPRGDRPRDGEGRREGEGEGRREGQGRGPDHGRPPGPPNPERFVDDAMRFDADKDGKLSKEELLKFAIEMGNRQGRPPGREGDRPPGDRPPRGEGREGDRPPGDRPPGEEREGDRPQRPPEE